MTPVIGITCEFDDDRTLDPPRPQVALMAAYSDAIYAAGGLPRPLPPPAHYDQALLTALLDDVDGLLFTGGPDLDPGRYGQPRHPQTRTMHARREAFELDLFRRADETRLPVLAICLGFQLVHVARGGRLLQHVDDLALAPVITHHLTKGRSAFHAVVIEPESRLAHVVGGTKIEVNSRHHQATDPEHCGRGLRTVARSPDGLIEASEDMDGRFFLAVQWHPENLIDRPEHLQLFEALIGAAGQR